MPSNDDAVELITPFGVTGDFDAVGCPECSGRMVIHQPDEREPERLLGTCRSCRGWFLVDAVGGTMLRLPGEEAIRGVRSALCTCVLGRGRDGGVTSLRIDGPDEMPEKRRPARGRGRRRRDATRRDGAG